MEILATARKLGASNFRQDLDFVQSLSNRANTDLVLQMIVNQTLTLLKSLEERYIMFGLLA